MNRIVLVILPSPWLISDRDMPNAGILYLASFLRSKGVDVAVADLCGLTEEQWRIPEGDIYGISSTTPQFASAVRVAKLLKSRQPEAKVVLGGPHPSAEPDQSLKATGADCAVVGEGEHALFEIASNGITARIVNAGTLNSIDNPWPARNLIDSYSYQKMGTNAVVGPGSKEEYLLTSRGCPYHCGFCAQEVVTQSKVRWRSMPDVARELKHLVSHYRVNRIYVYDDTFTLKYSRVKQFCDDATLLRTEFDFDWHFLSRADAPIEMFNLAHKAGAKQVTFGTEHCNDAILKRIGKQVTGAQNKQGIENAKNSGLRVRSQLIVGLPGETDETVEELAQFIRESRADSMGVHIFVPLPGSPVWVNPKAFNFTFNRSDVYDYYQTIGKPGEWSAHKLHVNSEQILQWAKYLKSIVADRNVHNSDARLAENKSK